VHAGLGGSGPRRDVVSTSHRDRSELALGTAKCFDLEGI
jgi:hypothetical protein